MYIGMAGRFLGPWHPENNVMSKLNTIRSSYQCTLKNLTSVHIGSGELLKTKFDFFSNKGKIQVINQAKMFQQVEALGAEKIDEFTQAVEDQETDNWLKKTKDIDLKAITSYSMSLPDPKWPLREIREQIKDGFGNPLIAGNSLKGAFRTAIVKRLSKTESGSKVVADFLNNISKNFIKTPQPKFADQTICKHLLGKEPKINLLRTLSVGDFSFSIKDIDLQKVDVVRLTNKTKVEQKFSIYVEKINANSLACGQVSFDEFLAGKDRERHCFDFKAVLSLKWLIEAIRDLSEETINKELLFFNDKTGIHVKHLREFYKNLQGELNKLADNEVIMHLGWGIGWQGMTGQLLSNDDLMANHSELRKKLKLATKHLGFPFPKSRRLAVNKEIVQPMGWVHLSFLSMAKVRESEQERIRIEIEKQRKADEEKKYPWRSFLKEIDGIQDWGTFNQKIFIGQEAKRWRDRSDVAQTIKDKASEIRNRYQKKWDIKRDMLIADWLAPSKLSWEPLIQKDDEEKQEEKLSKEERLVLGKIKGYNDWGQYVNDPVVINKLNIICADELRKKFKGWECDNNRAKKDKQNAWKELQKRLKNLR
jgi:CRISPR type III-A-associated RAMP protein Csm5